MHHLCSPWKIPSSSSPSLSDKSSPCFFAWAPVIEAGRDIKRHKEMVGQHTHSRTKQEKEHLTPRLSNTVNLDAQFMLDGLSVLSLVNTVNNNFHSTQD